MADSSLADLTPDPRNARRHTERNIAMIADSIREVGAARSIVIDEEGVILAGNATVEAAAAAGIEGVRIIDVEGDELVAVRRTNLSPEQKARLALADNRAAELADGWDLDRLRELSEAGVSLEGLFSQDELDALYAAGGDGGGNTHPDAVAELRATDILPGDLFELGPHRILCGDSTKADDVARLLGGDKPRLMVTDPPYGLAYDPQWREQAGVYGGKPGNRQKHGTVRNDDRADWTEVWRLFPGDIAYVWHAGLTSSQVEASLELAKFESRAQIIWAKDRLALGRGDYHWQHEACWYAVRRGRKGHRTDDRSPSTLWRISSLLDADPPPEQTTVWDIPTREDGGHGHGTQKPVECMARPMRHHHAPEVFEPFSGSGTSIIAATMLGRRCYAIEIDPGYVQMAIDRWQAFTGREAVKVGEAVRVGE